jgi:phosphoglycolate phosphatase
VQQPAFQPKAAVRAVIFDLDGTLVDSAPDLAASANRMLHALSMAELAPTLLATFIGKGIPRLVERSLAGRLEGVADAALMARALPLFEQFYAEESGVRTTVYPGVFEGLRMLAEAGLPLACVTNKS